MHIRTREIPQSDRTLLAAIGGELGASLVELAIILPLAVLFIAGMVDLGYRINSLRVVSTAARHGARVAAGHARLLSNLAACGNPVAVSCAGPIEHINNTPATNPVTLVAQQSACNYLRATKNFDAGQWQVRTEVMQNLSEPPGDPRKFQAVHVSFRQVGGCIICYANFLTRFIGEGGARFILEGACG